MSTLESVRNIVMDDYDYPLPEGRIALHPKPRRDACRLLVHEPDGKISHRRFVDLPDLLPERPLLVRNDARVINARMRFRKPTGAEIEIFLLEPFEPADYALVFQADRRCVWTCLVGNLKRWKEGALTKELLIGGRAVSLSALRGAARTGNSHFVEFEWDDPQVSFAQIVEAAGFIPIPPYLNRDSEQQDSVDYQTTYSRVAGSVAAPTAGLHFTPEVFSAIESREAKVRDVTLHVGAGTFQPVKSDTIGGHPMHSEVFSFSLGLVRDLIEAKESGRSVVAVGTTSVRTLESIPYLGRSLARGDTSLRCSQWDPYSESDFDTLEALRALESYMVSRDCDSLTASTSILIAPGFRWRIVDILITNFHQPHSTLLLLVGAFLDRSGSAPQAWRNIYREALANDYKFLSYGDSSLLFPLK